MHARPAILADASADAVMAVVVHAWPEVALGSSENVAHVFLLPTA
jgi:hypothetical protein